MECIPWDRPHIRDLEISVPLVLKELTFAGSVESSSKYMPCSSRCNVPNADEKNRKKESWLAKERQSVGEENLSQLLKGRVF